MVVEYRREDYTRSDHVYTSFTDPASPNISTQTISLYLDTTMLVTQDGSVR